MSFLLCISKKYYLLDVLVTLNVQKIQKKSAKHSGGAQDVTKLLYVNTFCVVVKCRKSINFVAQF